MAEISDSTSIRKEPRITLTYDKHYRYPSICTSTNTNRNYIFFGLLLIPRSLCLNLFCKTCVLSDTPKAKKNFSFSNIFNFDFSKNDFGYFLRVFVEEK